MGDAINNTIRQLFELLFPNLCAACGNNLFRNEDIICTRCLYRLPYTNFTEQADNLAAKQFWGRCNIEATTTLLYFGKHTRVQNLMHQLKYNNKPEVGFKLGNLMGRVLTKAPTFENIELIVPVPLHPDKERKRGYNQSAYFAKGIGAVWDKPVAENLLLRTKATESQTRKSRYSRYLNTQEVFSMNSLQELAPTHVLLVDDVLTTGATLEACAHPLLQAGIKVSAATIAIAQ